MGRNSDRTEKTKRYGRAICEIGGKEMKKINGRTIILP
jgi:hypothetical protein